MIAIDVYFESAQVIRFKVLCDGLLLGFGDLWWDGGVGGMGIMENPFVEAMVTELLVLGGWMRRLIRANQVAVAR